MNRALSELQDIEGLDEERLSPILSSLADAAVIAEDAASEIKRYGEDAQTDPEALEEMRERLELIRRLKGKYGGSVEKPADPVAAGKKFIGWDNSFDNITKDTTINAIFEDTAPTVVYHTVTIKIADKTTTIQVEDGKDAPLPSTITLDGYIFRGWDTNYTNVKSDITVTAILETVSTTCNVKFIISGVEYNQVVERGGTAIPPFTPSTDINGNTFLKWDKPLTNITSDTVITAIFGKEYYTVTFVVDGVSYPVTVKSGEQAVPPFTPTTNSLGQQFMYWDGSFYSVSSDMTITAVFY